MSNGLLQMRSENARNLTKRSYFAGAFHYVELHTAYTSFEKDKIVASDMAMIWLLCWWKYTFEFEQQSTQSLIKRTLSPLYLQLLSTMTTADIESRSVSLTAATTFVDGLVTGPPVDLLLDIVWNNRAETVAIMGSVNYWPQWWSRLCARRHSFWINGIAL